MYLRDSKRLLKYYIKRVNSTGESHITSVFQRSKARDVRKSIPSVRPGWW